jgi:hypothetical protein
MPVVASPLDVSAGESGRLEQVDRGADNPHRNIITKPVKEAKARLWAAVPLMMMMTALLCVHTVEHKTWLSGFVKG